MTPDVRGLLDELRAAGGRLVLVGPEKVKIRWERRAPIPGDLIARLRRAKPAILEALAASPASVDSSRSHHAPAPGGAAPGVIAPAPQAGWGAEQWGAYLRFWEAVRLRDMTPGHAATFAWSVAQGQWERLHPTPMPGKGLCAGCGQPMTGPGLAGWPGALEIHDMSCLTRYGIRWRAAATAGLAAMGLKVPAVTPESEMAATLREIRNSGEREKSDMRISTSEGAPTRATLSSQESPRRA